MDITRTAYGVWSGGRFAPFGEPLDEERFVRCIRHAWDEGVRTFVTADVYGTGAADESIGRALTGIPRDSYCLVGMVGHDFYEGERSLPTGCQRFTDPALRSPREYADYLRMAAERSLERCKVDRFDCLMIQNPDRIGFAADSVWIGMDRLREAGLTQEIGIAPGPGQGFTLDLLLNFERFGALVDWAVIILNPFEPWPGRMVLPAAEKYGVNLICRGVDYGGVFHDDVKPGHDFRERDPRAFRQSGWLEAGHEKLEKMRPIAQRHGITMLQLACIWNFSHRPVRSVIPTMIQEAGERARAIEGKIDELAALPDVKLSDEEIAEIDRIGDNARSIELKGANLSHRGDALPDRWSVSNDLALVAARWDIDPAHDLACIRPSPAELPSPLG